MICVAALAPFLIVVLALSAPRSQVQSSDHIAVWNSGQRKEPTITPVVKKTSSNSASAPLQQPIPLAAVGILLAIAIAVFIYRNPGRMRIGNTGVAYEWPGGISMWIPWNKIAGISVKRPTRLSLDNRTWLVFSEANGGLLKVNMEIIDECPRKQEIAELIQSNAEPFVADAEAIDILLGSKDNSFTSLWLETLNTPSARRKTAELRAGDQLDYSKYKILKRLGTGGQGSAYLAMPEDQSGVVVLKEFILPGGGNLEIQREAIARFVKEAELLSSLSHPKVVRLFGHFFEDHRGYLILAHAQGISLREMVNRDGPLEQDRVSKLALEMLEILSYLHGRQPPVVHRDFTPDNLIVSQSEELTLVDFQVAQHQQASVTGTVVGKQSYIPLEQLRGQACSASDIYAMGATLYFLLTGQDPEPVSCSDPANVNQNISAALSELVRELTAVDPEERLTDLERIKDLLSNAGNTGERIKLRAVDIQST